MGGCVRTAVFETLGCRLNQAESALMTDLLTVSGYSVTDAPTVPPDLLLVNTCAVTASAAQKSRQALRRIRREYPDSLVVVTGCGVNVDPESWRTEGSADIVLTAADRSRLPQLLDEWFATRTVTLSSDAFPGHAPHSPGAHSFFKEGAVARFPFKTRAFLKVQDGCNCFCSYCIVPFARGPQRSRDAEEIFADFRALLQEGHREIVIAGVNTCTFRWSGGGIASLLRELLSEPGAFRLRLSSAEPHSEIPAIAQLMVDFPEKMCRFLHLPAQHLTDRVLALMNRHYTLARYESILREVRLMVPGIHIGTDLIVGFPGETADDFNAVCDKARELTYANMHVFPFSPREGTAAAQMTPIVPPVEIRRRAGILSALAETMKADFARSQLGHAMTVLPETIHDGTAQGWSDHYLRVRWKTSAQTARGILETVTPTQLNSDGTLS